MLDLARWCLAALWLGVAVAAVTGAGRRRAAEIGLAVVALALAAASVLRWHAELRAVLRQAVREAGHFGSRGVLKIATVGAVLVLALLLLPVLLRRPRRLRGALLFTVAWAAYLAAYTVELADHLPRALGSPPGRQLLELAFAAPALGLAVAWRRNGAADAD